VATVIKGRYELLETLGAGGEARVVKAVDAQHDRLVALKIRPVRHAETRAELLNEARVLLAVPPHPALPLVREDFFDGDDYVVAMDWVDGTDLETLLRDRGRPGLAASSVLEYLSDAAQALTHLHGQDPPIIHGDVKPGNLILTRGGRVMLVDFGLSSAPNARRRRAGTPGYRAPELAADGAPSPASDVFALAATAFALLTGAPPAGKLPSWEGVDTAQAEQLEAAIRLGLSTDPSRRPASAGELVERLRAGWAEALPTGVVTFVVSDIEASTAMWDSDPATMAQALVRHDALVTDAVQAHGGRLITAMGEGDSTVSAFNSAPAAVAAALDANRALEAEEWPAGFRIAARFALHTGEAERIGTNYIGPAIIVAARIRAQADAGQIFLSAVTAEIVRRHLPEGCSLVDLGPHRLKGLAEPERIHALRGAGVTAPLPATECPYRGLLAFEPENREFFFGRDEVVAELIERLAPGRLLALVGASGSGKSSVLRAGLVAAARAGEVPGVQQATVVTPGAAHDLDSVPDSHLIVVDQFEELFTLWAEPDRRQAFIADLLACRGPVAIGVRADLYGRLAAHPDLARAVAANQVLLGAMTDSELAQAVTEPARLAGLRVEPGLVELSVREVAGEPGALPLLSHALRATWERREGRTLTVEAYQESGGVAAALSRTADEVVDALPSDRRQLARNVFVRLTELGDGAEESRRRVTLGELVPEGVPAPVMQELLERLADARLVTLDADTAEVAHEVLIRAWPTLRQWLEDDREGLRLHRQLSDAARIWDTGGREPSDLYRGARLGAATDWAAGHQQDLNATERAFVHASSDAADRERRTQVRTNRRLRGMLAGTLLLLLVAVVAGVLAVRQRDDARAQALTSDAERVGALALSDPNVDHSLLLAVAGVKLQDRFQTRSDLFADLQQNAGLLRLIRPSNVEITALDVSPDGRLLVVGDDSGTVRFIDLASWRPQGAVVRLDEPIGLRDLSFSPDGRTVMAVAIGVDRSELYAIDVASRRARRVLSWKGPPPQPQGVIGFEAVAYSPDGPQVAVTEEDEPAFAETPTASRIVMLDAATGRIRWQRRYPLRPGQADPHVVFTAAGTLLTSAQQGDTLIWDPRTGRILRRYRLGGVPALAPDGHTVALGQNSSSAGDQSASVVLLDLRTGRHRALLANLPDHWIRSLAFTPDGSEIAGAATDGMHVWDVASGKIVASYVAGSGPRSFSVVDPDTDVLISGQQDGSLAAFDLSGARQLGRAFRWNSPSQEGGADMVVNRQSSLMATGQADGTIAIIDLRTLRLARTLPARDGNDAFAMFMPDGRTLVTAGPNRRVSFWDVASGRVTRTLRFTQPYVGFAASPDGKLLAVQTGPADGSNNHVEVVRISTGAVLESHALQYGPGGVEFTHDGRELVALGCCLTGSGSTLVAWDVHTGRQLFKLGDSLNASAFDIAPGSQLLGVGTESGQLLTLDPRTGRRTAPPIQVATGEINQVSFSPDGRSIAISSDDHTASVWDVQSGTRIGDTFGPYTGTVPLALFEPNGRLLIDLQSNAIQWPMGVNAWERFACQAAGRDLTRAEWHDVLPSRTYQHVCPGAG
jgi:WD40 repeat protein/class 3 adenylate cyclase/tRNA A-37 threonylcarbamoyl transferase component Bud32